jgi:hypothetical protein
MSTLSKPSLLFIDHAFHQKTRSTFFLRDILIPHFELTNFWIEPEKDIDYPTLEKLNQYDYILFFQRIPPPHFLKKVRAKIVWVQMYDSANFDPFYWNVLSHLPIKVLSFSKRTSKNCEKYGIDHLTVQYYLNPENYNLTLPTSGSHIFFWYRGSIRFREIEPLFSPNTIDRFTIRSHPDPRFENESFSPEDFSQYNINLIEKEFLSKEEYLSLLSRANIFIAPRKKEGIGMSFLEALAMGQCVIAHKDGTMDEYIDDGVDGYLFSQEYLRKIDLSQANKIGTRAKEKARRGYIEWRENIPHIAAFIQNNYQAALQNRMKQLVSESLYETKLRLHDTRHKVGSWLPRV